MSEEEMEILEELSKQNYFGDLPFLYYADLIGKLIANYNKEKEKNKELENIRNENNHCIENTYLIDKTKIPVERNKYLIEMNDGNFVDINEIYINYINKDKIKEILDNYKPNQSNTFIESQENYIKLVTELQELLEERN